MSIFSIKARNPKIKGMMKSVRMKIHLKILNIALNASVYSGAFLFL